MSEIDRLLKLLHKIYTDGYVQGRQDGIEGMFIEPQVILDNYFKDEEVYIQLFKLDVLKEADTMKSAASMH
ncbi:hypothetical protein [Alkalimonas amylolytica]|uniref:Uncharacterized protein n=1 Tax=Alkalimonas amylolytica TaxID=152573 RepID=A0A1H4AX77_ALKAM|nr:hypothetical protein [Alkalimonas amylolytica]SEA40465.1 hypothetical protein SAMN04488051_10367 [Alkalimonas amylolytica]